MCIWGGSWHSGQDARPLEGPPRPGSQMDPLLRSPLPRPHLPGAAFASGLQLVWALRCPFSSPHTLSAGVSEDLGQKVEVGAFGLSLCRSFYPGWDGDCC